MSRTRRAQSLSRKDCASAEVAGKRAAAIAPLRGPRSEIKDLRAELRATVRDAAHFDADLDLDAGAIQAMVTAPIVDAFVPQMLNYESVGGVNFKKGCYPGQEVVARSQFRGTLKRRAFLVHGQAAMVAGQDVFSAQDPDQPCGLVAQGAASPRGGYDAIVSVQISAAASGDLHLGSAQGPALSLAQLPYPLLDDI